MTMPETESNAPSGAGAVTRWAALEQRLATAPEGAQVALSVRLVGTDEGFAVNGDLPFPSASTIKVAILIALARAFDRAQLRPDDVVTLARSDMVGGSGVLNWLSDGLRLPLRDLAWLMIAISDNTASNILIDQVGREAIAEVLADTGACNSQLGRHFMAPKGDQPGAKNEITANDFLALLLAIVEDRAASPRQCEWMRSLLADQQVLDRLARALPDGVSFAGKSGWYDDICHDGGLLTGPKGTVGIVVLTRGFASMLDAKAFIGDLGRAAAELVSEAHPPA
jgi:beta-lactamase class A